MKIVSLQTSRHCFCFIVGVVVVVGLLLSNAVVDATPMATETNNECLNPVIGDVLLFGGICEPDCYCIPDRDPCEECPTLDNRVIAASAQGQEDANFFNSLEIDNVNTLYFFNTTNNVTGGCQPYPTVAQFLQVPVCDGLIQGLSLLSDDDDDSSKKMGKKSKKSKKSKKKKGRLDDDDDEDVQYQCSFDYGTDICESNKYNLVQEMVKPTNNKKKGKKNKKTKAKNDESNTFITHESTCGVCSTSKDLAINLSPTLDQDAFACTATATGEFQDPAQIVSVFPNLISCFQNIGFTSDCAFIWASNGLNTILTVLQALQQLQGAPAVGPPLPESCTTCALQCVVNDPTTNPECGLPISPGTCELTPCFSCDEDASGAIFKQYSGRTRRNSGIVTTRQVPFDPFPFVGTKRECSTISNIKQPSRTCAPTPVPTPAPTPTASPTATSIPGSESPGSESPFEPFRNLIEEEDEEEENVR